MKELDLAVLTRDIPEHGLTAGDVGTVVHVYPDAGAYEVEFMTGDGETLAVVTRDAADVRPRTGGEILHMRDRR